MNLRKRKSNPNEPNAVHKLCYPKRIRLEQSNGLVLMDLPLMPLHLIISKLSPRHRVLLRCASKQLKVEYIDYVLHYYKSITHYLRRDSNNSAKYFVWQVLADASNYFLNSGYDVLFADNLVNLDNQLVLDTLEKAGVEHMHKLLHEFYHTLEKSIGRVPCSSVTRIRFQRCRLLHTVTMLNLLRQFRTFRVISSTMNVLHWQLHIEVGGIFMFVFQQDEQTVQEEDKIVDFVALTAELLFYDKSAKNVSRFTEIGSSFYSYGLKFQPTKRGVRMDLKFAILAPPPLRKLFEEVIDGQLDPRTVVNFPLLDALSIELEVKSVRAGYRGGGGGMLISIVPLG